MQGDTEVRCPPVGDEKDDDDYRRTRHYVSDDPSEVSLEIWMGESFGSTVSFSFCAREDAAATRWRQLRRSETSVCELVLPSARRAGIGMKKGVGGGGGSGREGGRRSFVGDEGDFGN